MAPQQDASKKRQSNCKPLCMSSVGSAATGRGVCLCSKCAAPLGFMYPDGSTLHVAVTAVDMHPEDPSEREHMHVPNTTRGLNLELALECKLSRSACLLRTSGMSTARQKCILTLYSRDSTAPSCRHSGKHATKQSHTAAAELQKYCLCQPLYLQDEQKRDGRKREPAGAEARLELQGTRFRA